MKEYNITFPESPISVTLADRNETALRVAERALAEMANETPPDPDGSYHFFTAMRELRAAIRALKDAKR